MENWNLSAPEAPPLRGGEKWAKLDVFGGEAPENIQFRHLFPPSQREGGQGGWEKYPSRFSAVTPLNAKRLLKPTKALISPGRHTAGRDIFAIGAQTLPHPG
jgi:hypothetical protein